MSPDSAKWDLYDIYLLNSEGYYSSLQSYMKVNNVTFDTPNDFYNEETLMNYYNTTSIQDIWKKLIRKSHCSAIVKLCYNTTSNKPDIMLGHNTWSGYNELLRTLKKVDYAFEGDDTVIGMKAIKMKYSSYPGVIFSGDEFYTINHRIAITQTSLSIINYFQFKNAINTNTYIPEFMRIMMINYMSDTGKEWVDNYMNLFNYNHIYEAQWIVIDYNNLGINASEGVMYIVEEVPNSVKYIDYTSELFNRGYYGSFNVPFFKGDHADIAGWYSFNEVDFYSREFNPRQYILSKLQSSIRNLRDFKKVLMYNGYGTVRSDIPNDPSYKDPSNGWASREGKEDGSIDFKIINNELMANDAIWVYSGPVYQGNPHFKPYNISKASKKLREHSLGMPTLWNFKSYMFK